ncbi:hypothetical protein HN51_002306 [Arachis hypogaea]|uniref:Uncharacterized protein LOC107458942 isoform X1 n=1 Tax=Arachis duranensis TaxID=130453 RepID=A0A6P4BX77_ARADU|nr:uncharacterized protein LOC107458942 isoform X1 [Arachis duranensis]XP_025607585.1 uncharacterized protein LOC112700788 isoform X1 [Arachis hypogaea]QHO50501.1 uncharacterized protein DS421_1g23000 [Arachis hypogaea]
MFGASFHALTISSSSFSLSCRNNSSRSSMAASTVRIAVVGDVHDCWNLEEDSKALEFLQPDLVLFTGDFGDENVEVVQSVANLEFPKAVILGNHDSWFTKQFSGSEKDNVQLQLECLGEEHVAYQRLDFPMIKVSVVGGRPFSCGGKALFPKKLLAARYGIKDMDGSARRIHKAAHGTPEDHFLILLAHNGPTGLGSAVNDICGKDWEFKGNGDHGDPDLAQAISMIKENNQVSIPLVVFGHMHKELAYGKGFRKMVVAGTDNTIYLNGAIVPRVKTSLDEVKGNSDDQSSLNSPPEAGGTTRVFTLVVISEGRVVKIIESWVSVVKDRTTLEEEHILFEGS